MVLIHLKKGDKNQFLAEMPAQTSVKELTEKLVAMYDLRLRIQRLCAEMKELILYGPSKPVAEQGLDEIAGEAVDPSKPLPPNPDPTGKRTGYPPDQQLAEILNRTITEAMTATDSKMVDNKKLTTMDALQEAYDSLNGAIMIAYPQGLPADDTVRHVLEDTEEATAATQDIIALEEAQLWFASKQLMPDKLFSDHVGKNEKTKVVLKIQKKGGGAPQREPAVDEETQKAMMAHYYRKQEEMKNLKENEDDDYLHSAWANPSQLKNSFLGTGDIKWRPGR